MLAYEGYEPGGEGVTVLRASLAYHSLHRGTAAAFAQGDGVHAERYETGGGGNSKGLVDIPTP